MAATLVLQCWTQDLTRGMGRGAVENMECMQLLTEYLLRSQHRHWAWEAYRCTRYFAPRGTGAVVLIQCCKARSFFSCGDAHPNEEQRHLKPALRRLP